MHNCFIDVSILFLIFFFTDQDLRKPTGGKDVAPVLRAFWMLCGEDCYSYSPASVSNAKNWMWGRKIVYSLPVCEKQ